MFETQRALPPRRPASRRLPPRRTLSLSLTLKTHTQKKDALYTVDQRMKEEHVNNFNRAIAGVEGFFAEQCGAWNCLNYTDVRCVLWWWRAGQLAVFFLARPPPHHHSHT